MITIDGKQFIATHCDGDPNLLGRHLRSCATEGEITAVANMHQIDFAVKRVSAHLGNKRIASIEDYRDFAEWQYDFANGKWRFRQLRGRFPESTKLAGDFKPLTIANIRATF